MNLNPEWLNDLNESQKQAVLHGQGPLLILAGAGSGKTKTLVYRLAYLIKELKIDPRSVLAVTFTNKAAQEMRLRAGELLGLKSESMPLIGTFHSISARWLRREASKIGRQNNYTIYDFDDQKKLIKQICRQLNLAPKKFAPGAIQSTISRAKSDLISPSDFLLVKGNDYFNKVVDTVYQIYEEKLKSANAFDFDDLINKMVEVWSTHSNILSAYQNRFTHLLIDEYQDTNQSQYEWARLLAQKNQNLSVVGDDWQSIYSWRGANFGNILKFEKDYPSAKVVKLERNYRSTKNIIEAGNQVMQPAVKRSDKILWTNNPVGKKITVVETIDENHEAQFVLGQILSDILSNSDITMLPEGVEEGGVNLNAGQKKLLENYAILYRTNAQSRVLEEAFLKSGVPYQLIGGIRFYERKEIKDILAYLKLLVNPFDVISFARAITTPRRGIGDETIDRIINDVQANNTSPLELCARAVQLGIAPSKAKVLINWESTIKDFRNKLEEISITELITELIHELNLNEEWDDGSPEGEVRLENVEELKAVAGERVGVRGKEGLQKFLEEVSLWQDQDKYNQDSKGVTLMTLHSAKGLEFPVVFLVGMEEGLFPHNNSLNSQDELEEERRLCYVGITRAKEQLYFVYASLRSLTGSSWFGVPSRFLTDISNDLIEWKKLE